VEETEYRPSSAEVDQAISAQRGLKAFLRHGDLDRLPTEHRKGLSAFIFGPTGNFLLPPTQASRVLSCLIYASNLASLVERVAISGPSLVFLVDQVRFQMGAWSCDASCFSNNEQPDLSEGMGRLEIKPETVRFVRCAARDLIDDAAVDVQSWVMDKISVGMSALINEAIIIGSGNGQPLGLLNVRSGIPVCETSSSTPPGAFAWQDLVSLGMEVPNQWQQGVSFLMNQRTAGLFLTMSDALGRPLLQSMQGVQDGPRWSLLGFPIYLVSQMPNVEAGATPILFDNLKETYTIVTRQNPTVELDP
jgi:HK97 family phage major capsid protein